jgi:hypothetical protein
MKEYKKIYNMGLAFEEEKLMRKFEKMASEGYLLESAGIVSYKLVKATPVQCLYTMDYKILGGDDNYFEIFESGGWEHVCSLADAHFFRGKVDTVPIYTDKNSCIEKYKTVLHRFLVPLILSILGVMLSVLYNQFLSEIIKSDILNKVSYVILLISAMMFLPSIMTTAALKRRIDKIRGMR